MKTSFELEAVREKIKLFEAHRVDLLEQLNRNQRRPSYFTICEEKAIINSKLKELYELEEELEKQIKEEQEKQNNNQLKS
jgi:hypothetical protein